MSVALLTEHDNDTTDHVPVATEAAFSRHWQPLSARLGLVWVPLFQSGLPIEAIDLTSILDELVRLERAARADSELQHVADRAQLLLRSLQAIDFETVESVYIG